MFSFFKAKQPKPFNRFEIYRDGNCEFMVQVNSRHTGVYIDYNDLTVKAYFRGKRYANIQQAEKDIDYIVAKESDVLRKQQKTFIKAYP